MMEVVSRAQALLMRLAYVQLVLAGAAAVGVWIVQVLAGLPREPGPIMAVFLVFFAIYVLDRVAAEPDTDALNHPERERFARRHARKLLGLCAVAYGAALVLASRGGPGRVLILSLPLVAVLLYSFPFVPRSLARWLGFSRLKEILVIKNMVMAGTFATTLVLAPLPAQGAPVPRTLAALWVFLFLRFFINSVVFDMRDEHGDRLQGIRTIPVVLGVRTRWLLHALNLALGAFLLAVPVLGLGPRAAAALAVGTPLTAWYLWYFVRTRSLHFLCDVVVDGELYVAGLALLLVTGP
jgi:4-hydroxybenzoate polyprenyltransferase